MPPLRRLARAAADAPDTQTLTAQLTGALVEALQATQVEILRAPVARPGALVLALASHGATHAVAAVSRPEPFTAAEQALGEELADVAAAGFARLDAEARGAAGAARDHAVLRAARALNASLDLQEVLRTLAHEAGVALGADLSAVYLGDAEHGAVATAGYGVPAGWEGVRVPPGVGACGQVLATGEPYRTDDYGADVAPLSPLAEKAYKAALAVPVAWDDELKGVLALGWREARTARPGDLPALEAIAGLAAVACRNAAAYEHVQQVARTDALTGLLNHGALQVRIREEIARAEREGSGLACVIMDLDDFKVVNDSLGHQAGDELLRGVADLLRREVRPYDQIARYGGDEFVLLLPGTDENDARRIAERVRDGMLSARAAGDPAGAGGGCSIGVAAWSAGVGADALLEHADRALLLAKRTGKNRVAVANSELERELALLQLEGGSPAAVQALAAAIEARDHRDPEQTEQLVRLARGVALLLGMPAEQVERVGNAALLHDVGKLAVPAEILSKAGPLSEEEWLVMAEHPVAGERILQRTPQLAPLAPMVRHEHEHWDGSGYPDGLDGPRIPQGSRIILACDAYVAMIADRPYRAALSHDEAVAQLQGGAGRQFDPEVVEALLDTLGQNRPAVPDRASGVRLPPPPPKVPSRRSRGA